MFATSYVVAFGDAMDAGNPAEGLKHQAAFEALCEANKDLVIPYPTISRAYSEAGAYYFKLGQKSKARALFDKGLQLAPGDYELRRRKQMIN